MSNENIRLAKRDMPVIELRSPCDYETGIPILSDLGVLVRPPGALDRRRMKTELILNARQQVDIGFEQADPNDVTLLPRPLPRLVDGDIV